MAATYELIASTTVSSTVTDITFTSIPQTYTDLILKWSARINVGAGSVNPDLTFNTDTGTNYSRTYVRGGAATTSSRTSNSTTLSLYAGSTGTDFTDTFSSSEIYISSYTGVGTDKPISYSSRTEGNSAVASLYLTAAAGLYRTSDPIDELNFYNSNGFLSGSSFFLYGIKNS
jgi:hypothetical protein